MKIISNSLIDEVSALAKSSPRLRVNYNFHQSLDEKCHRFLNAVEPGSIVPGHMHQTKDETLVLLRGRVRVNLDADIHQTYVNFLNELNRMILFAVKYNENIGHGERLDEVDSDEW